MAYYNNRNRGMMPQYQARPRPYGGLPRYQQGGVVRPPTGGPPMGGQQAPPGNVASNPNLPGFRPGPRPPQQQPRGGGQRPPMRGGPRRPGMV